MYDKQIWFIDMPLFDPENDSKANEESFPLRFPRIPEN